MPKKRIFISSVQSEFAKERQALHDYILSDPLLGKFFEPFIFELLPAIDQRADKVYLKEIEHCDIYLGLLGKMYGSENSKGISPTELEFDHAAFLHKTKFIFLTAHNDSERHPKQLKFIAKVQDIVVRKRFSTDDELKSDVYATLVRYLIETEIIRTGPFDASFHPKAKPGDLDDEKIKQFVRIARSKRGFPLPEEAGTETILSHLNLLEDGRITNAAILLFGKEPQRFFINSEIRCAFFHGILVAKPIPSYKVFKGSVFELVDQAVDFVLAKLDYSVGTREKEIQIPGGYEIPKEIVAEAIVNAVAHRDYNSNGSVQVMLFSDRLEICNPGSLPLGWTTAKLKQVHTSIPANPLLAEPMYLSGYIERLGTGTADIFRIAKNAGLKEPVFLQEEDFKAIIYRPVTSSQQSMEATTEVTGEVNKEVKKIILVLDGVMKRAEIQNALQLRNSEYFRTNYIIPALVTEYIEMTMLESPTSPNQSYRLTAKGKALKKKLISEINKKSGTNPQDTPQVNPHVNMQETPQAQFIIKMVMVMESVYNREKIQELLGLKDRKSFIRNYLNPAIEQGYIELTLPGKPTSPKQQYRLSTKGKTLKQELKNNKK